VLVEGRNARPARQRRPLTAKRGPSKPTSQRGQGRLGGITLRLCAVLLLILGQTLSAEPLARNSLSFLWVDDQNALLKDGSVKVYADRFDALRLWRASPFEAALKPLFSPQKSTLAAEAMFVIPVALPKDPAARDAKLARAVTAVSTMAGLQVYSVSLKKSSRPAKVFPAIRFHENQGGSRSPKSTYQPQLRNRPVGIAGGFADRSVCRALRR